MEIFVIPIFYHYAKWIQFWILLTGIGMRDLEMSNLFHQTFPFWKTFWNFVWISQTFKVDENKLTLLFWFMAVLNKIWLFCWSQYNTNFRYFPNMKRKIRSLITTHLNLKLNLFGMKVKMGMKRQTMNKWLINIENVAWNCHIYCTRYVLHIWS